MKRSEKVHFSNANGVELSGIIDLPPTKQVKAFVLFAHCFTCSKTLKAVDNISNALTMKGFGVLRFDFTGLGQSGGEFADSNFSMNISDLISAYNFLENNHQAPQIVIGHSLGGAAVLHSVRDMPSVRAVVTVGAPANPIHVKHLIEDKEKDIETHGAAKVNIGGRPFTIKKQFLEDLERNNSTEIISSINKALLVIHSPQDSIVGIENAAEIYQAAKHPKSFISLDGADHLMSNPSDSEYVGSVVASWSDRYISENSTKNPEEGKTVVIIGKDHYRTEVQLGNHQLVVDEPESVGGKDLGPTPYDLMLAALGTCTAITLRMYADHKKIPLDGVEVQLSHQKIHVEDCEKCEQDLIGKIDQIERNIILSGDLDDSQRKRIIEIADKCPVHKTIEGKPEILTREIFEKP